MPHPSRGLTPSLADAVRRILATRGMSLASVSRISRTTENLPARIPQSFYSSLRKLSFSPSLSQLFALSRLSGYRLTDWLRLFGFSLESVGRFQVSFAPARTVELDTTMYRSDVPVPWLYDLRQIDLHTSLAPLSHWVELGASRQIESLPGRLDSTVRYLKIGTHDAFAFPDLLPGSVVRVREDSSAFEHLPIGKTPGRTLLLVRHGRGIACSRVLRSAHDKIVLCSRHLPYAPIELKLGAEAVVLGSVDLEFRCLGSVPKPIVSARLERYDKPRPLERMEVLQDAGRLIKRARLASGTSFREASARTRTIARELGDRRYYCSPSALSDYETRKSAPRHIHKLISLCAVYFASPAGLLRACGAPLEMGGTTPFPSEFWPRVPSSPQSSGKPFRFLREMRRRFGTLPWFLLHSASSLFRLPNVSLRDLFWVGDSPRLKYSCLSGAQFLLLDRRLKWPKPSLSCPTWAQPIYVLQRRGGDYLWGFCRLENGMLTLYSPEQRTKSVRLRNRVDAEVIGRVVGMIRRLK